MTDRTTCDRRWPNTDNRAFRGPHVCRLQPGHDGEHECACGARLEEEKTPR